jgi:hypothetical protein
VIAVVHWGNSRIVQPTAAGEVPNAMTQAPIQATSKSLFSLHYLATRLPDYPEWREEVAERFAAVGKLWRMAQEFGASWNEAQTEKAFIQPVLELLGWHYIVQTKSMKHGRVSRPDYTLFADAATRDAAYSLQADEDAFYRRALAIAEAKYWGRALSARRPARVTSGSTTPTPATRW